MIAKVFDRFDIKPRMTGTDHAPGLIVVIGDLSPEETPPLGTKVQCTTACGVIATEVTETKRHGPGVSFFLPGLTNADVSIGDTLEWQDTRARTPVTVSA